MERLQVEGEWWLPADGATKKVPGTFTFDPASHAQLNICTVDYRKWDADSSLIDGRFPIVIGVTKENEELTLLNCQPLYTVDERCGPYFQYTVGLRTDLVLKGRHFESPEDIQFDEISTVYTHLDNWLVVPSMDDEDSWIKEPWDASEKGSGYSLHYEDVFVAFDVLYEDAIIRFCSQDSHTVNADNDRFTDPKSIKLSLVSDKSYKRYIEYINVYIRNFLTLAVSRPTYPLDIGAKVTGDNSGEIVRLYFSNPGFYVPESHSGSYRMLFRYRDINTDFQQYFTTWMKDYERCRASHDVYFDDYFKYRSAPTTTFLLLTQAVEGYHRDLYGGHLLEHSTYCSLRNALQTVTNAVVVDHPFRDIFRGMMKRGNDLTFRRRLRHIATELIRDHFDSIFRGDPPVERESFITKIIATRNFYTHRSNDDRGVIPRESILDYTDKLDIVIKSLLLARLGIPSRLIERMLIPFVSIYHIKP